MARLKQKTMTKRTKIMISSGVVVLLTIIGTTLYFQSNKSVSESHDTGYSSVNVKEGTISSTTLLSGMVKAESEEYIYFDASKGTDATVSVNVGDKVTKGQQLVQYNTSTAQAAYDSAIRNLNKIGRQINYLKTHGVPIAESQEPQVSSSSEEPTIGSTVSPSATDSASYNQQLQDLNDAYADAQSEVNKAQELLNQTVIVSGGDGTVVEVNKDLDPSSKESQTLVHVASEGQLQVKGSLTEYDLANIKKDQLVKIKSKVYPEKEWQGKISYISNYPSQENTSQGAPASEKSSTSSTTNYEYKANITSPLDELKQGFTVSVEVVNEAKHLLVPVSSVFKEGKKSYVWVYDDSSSKVKKREVTIGNADANNQEILTGLENGQIVIANPNDSIKENKKLKGVESEDVKAKTESEVTK
ncbi:putative efflux system component YknX [Streptococcus parauberis]|uniref:efflux RND transporter periplasmic adaptor subunit n=1 Tax=Streptococcus parauberis TaxID=1348 RepID=UPI0009786156|nr:efflux RND transporter periplasmic adaptor subunit [Streptococcus parauberis]ONH63849.1 putative efflux system component YknX [Streptococcus parauberis]PCH11202.1 putative efflux system component YknX [Streptococcus parauberis]